MKKNMVTLLAGLSVAALLAGGCTKDVKKDEPIAPAVVAKAVEPAKPVEEIKPVEAKPVEQAKPVQEVVKADDSQTAKPAAAELKFETIYFDFDKSDLRQDARDVLSKNAEIILKSMAGAKIKVEGHCDERGSAEYNLTLGERRATSALKYLTTLGVKAENLSIISYGKEKPAVIGTDESAWAKNRRAEFVVVK